MRQSNSSDVKIRAMEARDLEQVTILASQLGYPTSSEQVTARFNQARRSEHHAFFVAVSKENQVVGWIQMSRENLGLLSDPKAEVSALVVDEACRGRRIGARLLQRGEQWADERGLRVIRLRSNMKREEAHRFYKREGYSIQKSSYIFIKTPPAGERS
jgi:GNAT superfamily N-acetyltransferase